MSDLISRQAAIDAINHICPVETEYDCTLLDRVDVRYVLSDLPSAQPERKKGHWIHSRDEEDGPLKGWMPWYCSNCGAGIGKHQTAFCPNCGADMREVDDERPD